MEAKLSKYIYIYNIYTFICQHTLSWSMTAKHKLVFKTISFPLFYFLFFVSRRSSFSFLRFFIYPSCFYNSFWFSLSSLSSLSLVFFLLLLVLHVSILFFISYSCFAYLIVLHGSSWYICMVSFWYFVVHFSCFCFLLSFFFLSVIIVSLCSLPPSCPYCFSPVVMTCWNYPNFYAKIMQII